MLPALSVGRAILNAKPESEILFVGSQNPADREAVEAAGFKFVGIPAGKLRRYFAWQNLWDSFKILLGVIFAKGIILKFRPDKVFIKGGYVGVPVGVAAWLSGKPIILHESDAQIGLANRFLIPLAKWICVAFPKDSYHLSANLVKKLVHTGIPLHEIFYQPTIANNTGIPFSEARPVILIIGGSQGARAINQIIQTALPDLVQNYQVIHLAGKNDFSELKAWAETERFRNYYLFESLSNEQVAYLMRRAAVIISRAGATAIAEIAASARPAVLVPLPGSANDHQFKNAEYVAAKGAAVMVEQAEFSRAVLQELIFKILNSDLGHRLVFNIKSLMQKDADIKIADLILTDNNFDEDKV